MLKGLINNALLAGSEPSDASDDAILDAAMAEAVAYGFRRLTMEEVARRAAVGRVTVYRRFASKDDLLRRLLAREARRFILAVAVLAGRYTRLADRVVEAFVATLRLAREHPLLDRLVRIEPESLVAIARSDDPDLLALARNFVAGEIERARASGDIGDIDAPQTAEVLVRLATSFVLLPRSVVNLADDSAARGFARRALVPILGRQSRGKKRGARQ